MSHKLAIICGLIFLVLIFYVRCDKEEENLKDPAIEFKKDEGYTYKDTSVPVDDSVKIGIIAESNGTDNLVLFKVILDDEIFEDFPINKSRLNVDITITKSENETEEWKFKVIDNGERSDSVFLTLTKE
jgi:hypothetical protein